MVFSVTTNPLPSSLTISTLVISWMPLVTPLGNDVGLITRLISSFPSTLSSSCMETLNLTKNSLAGIVIVYGPAS